MTRTSLVLATALALSACSKSSSSSTPPSASTTRAPATAAPNGSSSATAARVEGPLKDILANATLVHIRAGTKTADVKDAKQIQSLVAALGSAQSPSDSIPKCLTTFTFEFADAANTPIAAVGLCDTPGLAEYQKDLGRIDAPSKAPGGIKVADLAALRAFLKSLGIELP